MKNKFIWKDKKILVTGGTGFLGRYVVKKIKLKNPRRIVALSSQDADLRDYEQCKRVCNNFNIVIHLAANVGGIGYNRNFPATLFEDNILMGVNMMRAAMINRIEKYIALGTICAYPKNTPVPFKEINFWNGYPEETNAAYGLAKKMQLVQAQAYRQQYNFNAIYLVPVNLYGPGDNFDPKKSHVIPALVKKFVDAKKKGLESVVVWGTGKATREFLFVEDAADAIILALEKYNKPEPVNIGAGFEISIKELSELIKNISKFEGKIVWDKSKPDGQPRRKLDVSRARNEFGFVSKTNFKVGLEKTINWYNKFSVSK